MATKKFSKAIAVISASAMLSLSTVQSAYAAPGALATAPLFLSTIVEPNVYFTVDDSGSMDYGPVLAEGAGGLAVDGGLPRIDGERRAYYAPQFSRLYGAQKVVPPADDTDPSWQPSYPGDWKDGWVVRNHNANLNYYNPAVTYVPWPGTKADGTPMYTDADPTAAKKDPWDSGSETVNLTVSHDISKQDSRDAFEYNNPVDDFWIAVYYLWTDTDGDGEVDTDDEHKRVVIPNDSPGEMLNFANWFQYYRSRMNAAKSIIGATINNTDASRMGMHQFNDGQLDEIASMSDAANKRDLLEKFYTYDVKQQGTPMRRGLEDVGQYFDDTGSNAPILPAADGGECQQNFNILIGDGFWSGSDPSVGNTDVNGGSGDNNSDFDGDEDQSNDLGNYADSYSNTLADVAMWDYERDLRPDLDDKVPTQIVQPDPNNPTIPEPDHQHLETYAISFGPIGTLDPTVDDPLAAGFAWPDPTDGEAEKIDDMWHAAYNGRGKFLTANDPISLLDALNQAISDIAEKTATAAAVSINSARLTTDAIVYLAQFNTNRWQGDLEAFRIADPDTGALATTRSWSAAEELNNRIATNGPARVILTHDGSDGVAFQWDDLSAAQQDDLKTSPSGGVDTDAVGEARLEYLRGDRTNEGTGLFFRERASMLSDLVNSGPVYVGAPSLNWPDTSPFPTADGQRYSDFKEDQKDREGVVYIGSNGGMLHGFAEGEDTDGDDILDTGGEELIAYVPNNLFSIGSGEGLHYLTDPNYIHKYYNDLTPTISDIYANLGTGTRWETVLISGQRGGGRGIFALKVTDPNAFLESNAASVVLWEFTDADLGYTYSRPQIGRTNDNKWVAIFGNGYNDTGSGEAKLFIVDIQGGADGTWDSTDVIEISTGSGDATDRNGLATPSLADLDGNGTIDRVWAGDLKGQMWAFDLSGATSSATASLLFTTAGNRPITSKPALAKHPTVSDDGTNAPNVMVYFGSGQYLVDADKTIGNPADVDYFYGVWDRGATGLASGSLVQQTFETGFDGPDGNPARVLTRNTVDYAGGKDGWFFALPEDGERSVTNAVVRGGIVFFNSFVPVDDPCSVGGFGFRFAVDMITGGSPDEVAFDTDYNGELDEDDKADNNGVSDTIAAIKQDGFLPEPVFIEDIAYTAEEPSKVVKLKNIPKGRFSWQELIQ